MYHDPCSPWANYYPFSPKDINHLDFYLGYSAYFDLRVPFSHFLAHAAASEAVPWREH